MTLTEFNKFQKTKLREINNLSRQIRDAAFFSIIEMNANKILAIITEIKDAKKTLPDMEV